MKVKYVSKNYKVTTKFKDIIEKKLEKLEKYFPSNYEVKVACTEQNNINKLEITINADGLFLRSEVVSDNMYNNIDMALPKIEKQIIKNSTKYKSKFRRTSDEFEFLTEMPEFTAPRIAKKKRFELEPMTESDAEAQMEALGHTFFVFLNAKTGLVSVLYKRNDANLGMIEITY